MNWTLYRTFRCLDNTDTMMVIGWDSDGNSDGDGDGNVGDG